MSTVKDEIRKLAEQLPESATWDEVMYDIYVRQKIADGETAIAGGRIMAHSEVKKRFTSALKVAWSEPGQTIYIVTVVHGSRDLAGADEKPWEG